MTSRAAPLFLAIVLHDIAASLRHAWHRARYRATGVRVARSSILRIDDASRVDLGDGVSIGAGTIVVVSDEGSPRVRSALRIGDGTAVNEYCNIRAAGGVIDIGRFCLLAQFVSIVASNHGLDRARPIAQQDWDARRTGVRIGDHAWIGAGAVLLPGATVGDGAVVAAGSVITGNVPAFEIWGGVPGRRISVRPGAEA